jgi:hypothetical protein
VSPNTGGAVSMTSRKEEAQSNCKYLLFLCRPPVWIRSLNMAGSLAMVRLLCSPTPVMRSGSDCPLSLRELSLMTCLRFLEYPFKFLNRFPRVTFPELILVGGEEVFVSHGCGHRLRLASAPAPLEGTPVPN